MAERVHIVRWMVISLLHPVSDAFCAAVAWVVVSVVADGVAVEREAAVAGHHGGQAVLKGFALVSRIFAS